MRFLLDKLDQFFPINNPNIEIPIRGQNNPIEAFLIEMPTGHIIGLADASPTIRRTTRLHIFQGGEDYFFLLCGSRRQRQP